MRNLINLAEPRLLFRHGQAIEDPRDGLMLFGPLDSGSPYGIRSAVVGTKAGIEKYQAWVQRIQSVVKLQTPLASRPPFPGFDAVFRVPWSPHPLVSVEIDEAELKGKAGLDERHQRVFETVDLFVKAIVKILRDDEAKPDVWFIVIPDYIRRYCRPEGIVDPEDRRQAQRYFKTAKEAKVAWNEPFLFDAMNADAEPYLFKQHFRNQLKARLLEHRVTTQILRESTLENIGHRGDRTGTGA